VISILAVEIQRALARRLVRVLVLLALLGIAIAVIVAFANADPNELDQFSPADIWAGSLEDESVLGGSAFLFLLMAVLGGSSFIGAEYRAGTFTTLLTWEPRRLRVLAAKLLAAAIVTGVLFVVLEMVLAGALAPVVIVRGTGFEDAGSDFYRSLAGFLGRGALVAGGCAVLGASIALIGRNTTAALGVVLGYIIIVEQILRGLRPGWDAWYLAENLGIVLGDSRIDDVARSVPGAGAVLLGYLAVAVAASTIVFARRDVT
jgi:ABC-type transport system involved in multi-copper enzyme maturation permease subunit